MLLLGIETSCDETSAALVANGYQVHSCAIASSRSSFVRSGGVIPEEAARQQLSAMLPALEDAFAMSKKAAEDIDAIAVTSTPGLLGSLLVGTTTARVLSTLWNKPLISVHHTLGHLTSPWLTSREQCPMFDFPILALSVSGGHSDLWYRKSHTQNNRIAFTLDDAAGEAFDKGATMLGLPYPGGPSLSSVAATGNSAAFSFPIPLKGQSNLRFSFSGLKTSLKYLLQDLGDKAKIPEIRADVAASYQEAICIHLMDVLTKALEAHPDTNEIHLVGGVSANSCLQMHITTFAQRKGLKVRLPEEKLYCTDNAAMIAAAGFWMAKEKPECVSRLFKTDASSTVLC